MNITTVGGRVWAVREKFGLSRREFSERLGCQEGELLNVEYNRLKKPEQKESLYRNISAEFGVSLDWIKTGDGDMFGGSTQDEIMAAFGELAAQKDPIVDGFILFLRQRTPEQRKAIAKTLRELVDAIAPQKED